MKLGVNLDGVQFKKISVVDNERLYSIFKDEEIIEAVNQCKAQKVRVQTVLTLTS